MVNNRMSGSTVKIGVCHSCFYRYRIPNKIGGIPLYKALYDDNGKIVWTDKCDLCGQSPYMEAVRVFEIDEIEAILMKMLG